MQSRHHHSPATPQYHHLPVHLRDLGPTPHQQLLWDLSRSTRGQAHAEPQPRSRADLTIAQVSPIFVRAHATGCRPGSFHIKSSHRSSNSPASLRLRASIKLRPGPPNHSPAPHACSKRSQSPTAFTSSSSSSTQLSPVPCLKDRPRPNSPREPLYLYL